MRISDWSSDVCSSDLVAPAPSPRAGREFARHDRLGADCGLARRIPAFLTQILMLLVAVVAALVLVLLLRRRRGGGRQRALAQLLDAAEDRKSVVLGQSVSVSVDLGGRRLIKKKIQTITPEQTI